MGFFWRSRDSEKLLQLTDDFRTLKRQFADLELDWVNAYSKFKSIVQRNAKLTERAEAKETQQAAESLATPISTDPRTGRLSDRQKEIQQQILRRRAGA